MNREEHRRQAGRVTSIAIAGNCLLFIVKGVVGLASGSIALISDALNSLVDVASSIGISYSVAVAHRAPDEDHPFGHHRAEPLAALSVAIFTAILGFSVGRVAVERLVAGAEPIRVPLWAVGALVFSILGNSLLSKYLRRRGDDLDSPAILANAVECENDIWASVAALIGVIGAWLGWSAIDPIAGIFVGAWIVYGGYTFGRQNIDYLMGKSPAGALLDEIRIAASGIAGVRGVHDVRGHYVGHKIHVEVHIEVDQELPTRRSHDVAGAVRHAVEESPSIDRVFVHVDPVLDSTLIIETLAESQRSASEIYTLLAAAHGEQISLGALWRALATAAQLRADRLAVVRRLKGAGWHFADGDLQAQVIAEQRDDLRRVERELEERPPSVVEALDIALRIESVESIESYRRATKPEDPTMLPSLAAATPPSPSTELIARSIGAAASEADSEVERQKLEALLEEVRSRARAG